MIPTSEALTILVLALLVTVPVAYMTGKSRLPRPGTGYFCLKCGKRLWGDPVDCPECSTPFRHRHRKDRPGWIRQALGSLRKPAELRRLGVWSW